MAEAQDGLRQGDIWWAELPEPAGSAAGYRRPVIVVQGDQVNASRVKTVVCVPLTSRLDWAVAETNLLLRAETTGLPRDSVAQTNRILTIDQGHLTEWIGRIDPRSLQRLFVRLDVTLGRA